jgi:hypothetical protein
MPQDHAFRVTELALAAQKIARPAVRCDEARERSSCASKD